jgi:Suppressor of fused protein (SUFU)
VHAITYTRERDGVFFHGTISDLDGAPRATWSFDHDGKRVKHEQPVDAPTFRKLWNGFAKIPAFRRHKVTDPDRDMDWKKYHAILVTFGEPGKPRQQAFLIPPDEADPEFRDWLEALDVPNPKVWAKRQAATAKNPNATRRQEVYAKYFGGKARWFPDEDPQGPPIGVYVFEPGGKDFQGRERPFYTLVTDGLSDARMRTPKGADFRRAELVLYVEEPTDQHIEMLRFLAQLPLVQEDTWYGPGTTMTNGTPPRPIFDDSALDCYLFLQSISGDDSDISDELVVDRDEVVLLWVVPITNAECEFILDNELDDFLEILDRKGHFLLDETRRSYVRPKW